jgi:hypothetical protein
MRRCLPCLSCLPLLLALSIPAWADARFDCGGGVEHQVWDLWDGVARKHVEQKLLRQRLLDHGDVFALYDIQSLTHNMVAMARRCHRQERLSEVAGIIGQAYRGLEAGPFYAPARRWTCRGGDLCSKKNGLLDKEVKLNSVQFLALAATVANALATSGRPLRKEDRAFIDDTVDILSEHLLRWGGDGDIEKIRSAMAATPADVRDGSSKLFFTDFPLWLITIYAELAGILATDRQAPLNKDDIAAMRRHAQVLMQFFSARISYRHGPAARIGGGNMADLDRGYWRLYPENRYAGYESEEKPVSCQPKSGGSDDGLQMAVLVPPDAVPPRADTGWDLSHARRLVHALDALARNRNALKNRFLPDARELPSANLTQSFANNLVGAVWNGDSDYPLFSNYWSGANGWYRVAYRGALGKCREGEPPYALSSAFLTGGYITWSRYRPVIGRLGKRLYTLLDSREEKGAEFIGKYYSALTSSTRGNQSDLLRFAFYPTLVSVAVE